MRYGDIGFFLLTACASSVPDPRESIDLPPSSAPAGGKKSSLNYSKYSDQPAAVDPRENNTGTNPYYAEDPVTSPNDKLPPRVLPQKTPPGIVHKYQFEGSGSGESSSASPSDE